MKTILRYILPVAGLALAAPVLVAAEADETPKEVKHEKRIIMRTSDSQGQEPKTKRRVELIHAPSFGAGSLGFVPDGPPEMEMVTFLGVQTRPLEPTLRAQLGIAEGTGLVVDQIVSESSAVGVLQAHDILLKLDDQVLVNMEQLSVLVRTKQEGDKVALTYIRGGKESKASVTLGRREMPKRVSMRFLHAGPGMEWSGSAQDGVASISSTGPDNLLWMMDVGRESGARRVIRKETDGDDMVFVSVNTDSSAIELKDDVGALELVTKEGRRVLTATDPEGNVIFNGPVDTEEEKAKLPPEVSARLEKLEEMPRVQFRTEGEIKTETKVRELPGREARIERGRRSDGLRRLDVS